MTEDKAPEIAHGLIQGYIGPDHKVIDMKAFFSALVRDLNKIYCAQEKTRSLCGTKTRMAVLFRVLPSIAACKTISVPPSPSSVVSRIASVPAFDEARRIAVNVAELRELLTPDYAPSASDLPRSSIVPWGGARLNPCSADLGTSTAQPATNNVATPTTTTANRDM